MEKLVYLLAWLAAWILAVAAYVQHLFSCIKHESLGLLVSSIVFPPIGVIHGWLIWFGLAAK